MTTEHAASPDSFFRSVSLAAAEAKALLVDAIVSTTDRTTMPVIRLEPSDAIKAIQHLTPKVVCIYRSEFDLELELSNAVEEVLEEDGAGGQEPDPAPIRKALKKWQSRNGETSSVIACFIVDGVFYSSISTPDWQDEFDEHKTESIDAARRALSDDAQSRETNTRAEIRERGAALAAHASFNAGRPSFDKRLFLAEQLFPDLDDQQLHEVTSYAEKQDWFTKTNRS